MSRGQCLGRPLRPSPEGWSSSRTTHWSCSYARGLGTAAFGASGNRCAAWEPSSSDQLCWRARLRSSKGSREPETRDIWCKGLRPESRTDTVKQKSERQCPVASSAPLSLPEEAATLTELESNRQHDVMSRMIELISRSLACRAEQNPICPCHAKQNLTRTQTLLWNFIIHVLTSEKNCKQPLKSRSYQPDNSKLHKETGNNPSAKKEKAALPQFCHHLPHRRAAAVLETTRRATVKINTTPMLRQGACVGMRRHTQASPEGAIFARKYAAATTACSSPGYLPDLCGKGRPAMRRSDEGRRWQKRPRAHDHDNTSSNHEDTQRRLSI